MMSYDMELLREYASCRSEYAFETLVSRHVGLVYSAALRQVRDPHLATEITQAVFIILAQKAGSLSSRTILPGWLYRTTRFTAANMLRTAANRQRREQEAYMRSTVENAPTEPAWQELSPLLDEAMAQLGQIDRDALVLRYFRNKSLQEVGEELGLKERAAQKRVARGLEKLRIFFGRRGVALSTITIASAMSAHSVQAAPTVLTSSVTAAVTKGTAVGSPALALAQTTLKVVAWMNAKSAVTLFCSIFFGPILSLFGSYYAVKASLKYSKSARERSARLRFGWKLGIATIGLSVFTGLSGLINVTRHPWLFGIAIALPVILYVPLIVLWSLTHNRELKQIQAEVQPPASNTQGNNQS
jgi:RNA polymerase sigma factor (sigma-70 family)